MALSAIEYSLSTFGQRYLDKVFTPAEQAYCSGPDRIPRMAARFAAKEAVIKAFAAPGESYPLCEIEVSSNASLPGVRLTGTLAERAAAQGWRDIAISLSHTDCHAAAVVVVVCA